MSADKSVRETKVQRLELLFIYGLCVALLAGLGFLWLRQQGWLRSAPAVEHSVDARPEKPIEINTAKWADLTLIRNIGEARAKEIIFRRDARIREQKRRRQKPLGFRDMDDFTRSIDNISGINQDVLDELRNSVRVEPIQK
jgi:hypothetical protein